MSHKDSYSIEGMTRPFFKIKAQFIQKHFFSLLKFLDTPNILGLESKQISQGGWSDIYLSFNAQEVFQLP